VKLTLSSSVALESRYANFSIENDQTARISLQISRNVKKQGIKNNPNRAISFVAPSSHLIPEL